MRTSTWIWLAPLAFVIHDAEELATLVPWLRAHALELPAILQPHAAGVTTRGMAVSVAILLAAFVLAAWHGERRAQHGARSWPFLVAAGALAGNALTHVGQAAYFGGYTPGVATAVLVTAPYSVCLARALERATLVTRRRAVSLLLLGVLLQVPIALAAWAVGGHLAAAAP